MGKVVRRIIIAVAVLVVVLFVGSFAIDRIMLNKTFSRVVSEDPGFLPNEEYMAAYKSTPVEFQLNGQTLRGYVYEADDPSAFIVFRHGIFSQHCDYLALVSAMVDRGYTVFAYDALGCGISDGDSTIGMAQSAIDVAAAVQYVRDQGLANALPLVLWGHSWGGYGVAAAMDIVPDVDACITMSGYNVPVEVLVDTASASMGPIAATQRPTLWLANKLAFGDDADRTALDGINKTEAPVLVVHGTGDEVVRYDVTSVITQRDRITNPNVEYLVFDEKDHDGHNTYFYADAANDYLDVKRADLAKIEAQYPDGVPEDVMAAFMADYDQHRGNIANPKLINAIDVFITKAIGGDVKATDPSQYGALQSARYTNSGNSLGNRYELEAMRADDGSLIVVEREAEMHSMPTTVREFRADADLLDRIAAIVDEADMKEWGDLPLTEFIAYDASTPSLTLTFDNANASEKWPVWLSVSTSNVLPDDSKSLYAIRDLLDSYVSDANLIRQYEEPLR